MKDFIRTSGHQTASLKVLTLTAVIWCFAAPHAIAQTISFDSFIQEWKGRGIDVDHMYGNQCMDLMHQYTVEVLGFDALHAATAYQAYLNGDNRFDKIANTATGVPQKGDLVFWNTSVGDAGHVAVFIQGDINGFSSFDQNWPLDPLGQGLAHVQSHNWNGVAGWLHPRSAPPVQVTSFFQKNSNGQYAITCPTDNLVDAQFQLANSSSNVVNFPSVAMALHRESDDGFITDVHVEYNVTIPASTTYQFPRSFLDGTNANLQPGTYRLVAMVLYGGVWIELSTHLPFTIVSRSNSCGQTVTDPYITRLANTTLPVQWFYIRNQSTGLWYIVSTLSGVMMLDRVDKNTSFGIYWKPINTAASIDYADAGKNYSYVNISSDGRTVSFGSLTGGSQDPQVTALANTIQPVLWYYIETQPVAWYIVSPTGGSVMLLDKVDQNTTFGIYWKPISNSSFTTYAPQGQRYSHVDVSSDGRTISFGALQ